MQKKLIIFLILSVSQIIISSEVGNNKYYFYDSCGQNVSIQRDGLESVVVACMEEMKAYGLDRKFIGSIAEDNEIFINPKTNQPMSKDFSRSYNDAGHRKDLQEKYGIVICWMAESAIANTLKN